ncbi:MAG TPA: ChbG/HpnK family deacetylase [Solirubrobacteraceae bacterium]|nr:ChbG/HpnK family deacetylase [Solirubrobacteraceae bacterium]
MSGGGLLIVNADDWGMDADTTAAIAECLQAGAVTSVSAMVHMRDSEAAAALPVGEALSAGLHINLTEPFTAADIDEAVRSRQARIAQYLNGPNWRRWGVSPTLFREVERAIADQLAEFKRLYRRDPSHFDGHEHIHQSLGVLAARTLPTGAKMRPSFTYLPAEKSAPNRAVRSAVNGALRARFQAPRYFFSIRDMHPSLGGAGIEEKLALSSGSSVEVMCHPGWADERTILLDDAWRTLLAPRTLGSYEQLGATAAAV